MSRTLSFPAIVAIGVMLVAPSRAQDASQDAPRETPPPAPLQTPEPQPQAQPQQAQPPELGDPRFAFHRIDNGFLRLDLRTGTVASCRQQDAGWACVLAPEERAAFDSEIARLQRENAILKNALLERGATLPNAPKGDAPPPAELVPRPPQSVPPIASSPPKSAESDRAARDDAELERIMTMMEKVWRRLVEMMVNIQRDMQKKG